MFASAGCKNIPSHAVYYYKREFKMNKIKRVIFINVLPNHAIASIGNIFVIV